VEKDINKEENATNETQNDIQCITNQVNLGQISTRPQAKLIIRIGSV
jgi:hypothetical protein